MRQLCAIGGCTSLQYYAKEYERLGIDYRGKVILNLEIDLWNPILWNSAKSDVEIEIQYFTDEAPDGIVLENIVVSRPHPNKNIVSVSTKYGRKISKAGVQIVLDNTYELNEINRILITWKLFLFRELVELVIADYSVKFANPVEDGIYSAWSYERSLRSEEELLRYECKEGLIEQFKASGNDYGDLMYLNVDSQTEYENVASLYKLHSVFQAYNATPPFAISYYNADVELTDNVVCLYDSL